MLSLIASLLVTGVLTDWPVGAEAAPPERNEHGRLVGLGEFSLNPDELATTALIDVQDCAQLRLMMERDEVGSPTVQARFTSPDGVTPVRAGYNEVVVTSEDSGVGIGLTYSEVVRGVEAGESLAAPYFGWRIENTNAVVQTATLWVWCSFD